MASSSSSRKSSRSAPLKDRRAQPGAGGTAGSLRKLKGALVRPIALERRDGKLQVVLSERRRARPAEEEPSIEQLCAELSARMLAREADQAVRTMRQLIFVHDALERKGWAGVAGLSPLVLGKALEQLDQLAEDEPSPQMALLVGRLQPLHKTATLREARESLAHDFRVGDNLEVSESDFADFEDAEQEWVATMPADFLPPPGHDD
jgi:hypothetical protein